MSEESAVFQDESEVLTPEELAADDDGALTLAELHAQQTEGQASGEPGDEPAPGQDADPAVVEEEPAPEPPANQEPEPAPAPDLAEQPAGIDFAAQLADIDGKIGALASRYDDGELTTTEYELERLVLLDARSDTRMAMMQEQAAANESANAWTAACETFIGATQGEFYGGEFAEMRLNALDAAIKSIAPTMPAGTSNEDVLAKAHSRVMKAFGMAEPVQQEEAPKPAVPVKPKPQLPPNIGSAPQAESIDPSSNPYAAIDRLTGDEAEEAVQRMTPAQRAAWLKAG